jgi:hypothetical protein
MGCTTRLRRAALIALLPVTLVGCHGSTSTSANNLTPDAPETALGAAALLQAAGIYPAGNVHVSSGKDLQSLNGAGSYPGVVSNVFSPSGDEVAIWQFKTATEAAGALRGSPPVLTVSADDYAVACGPLLVIGDSLAKTTAAKTALAKRFADCKAVGKAQ